MSFFYWEGVGHGTMSHADEETNLKTAVC